MSTWMRVATLGLCLWSSSPVWADATRFAVVDVQKVMDATPTWSKALDDLKRELEKKKAGLEAEQAQLQKKKEQIDAKRTVSDAKILAKEEAALLEEAKIFHQGFLKAQQELGQAESQLREAMLARVERVVYELAEEGDFSYVVEAGSVGAPNVLYSAASLDLTPKVIESYRKIFKDSPLQAGRAGQP